MHIRAILQRREAIREELRALVEKHPDGDLPAEAVQRSTELEAEAERLNAAERRQLLIDEMDRRATGQPLTGDGTDANFEKLAGQVTLLDVVRAQLGGTDAASGRAKEVSAELERRSGRKAQGLYFSLALSGARRAETRVYTTTLPSGGPGGSLIQTDVGPLIDILRARLIIRALGATVLSGLQGNLSLPRLKASATAYWVAENTAITVSDPQTDAVGPMTPKTVGGLVEISRNMVIQPSLDVAAMVENDLMQIIARALDSAAIQGGGTNQPKGLLAGGSGITIISLGTNGGAPDWNSTVGLIAAVDIANALQGSLGFATNGAAVSKLRRTLKTTTDTASNFLMTDAATLAGYPLQSSQLVPANGTKGTGTNLSALIFGDWSQLVLGLWADGADILVNPYESTAYSKGNVQIRCMLSCDVAIKQPLAFAAVTDMVTT
jgi:HK97 family phage major capsid protein